MQILYLYWASSQALLRLTQFADSLSTNGTLSKKRMIFPGRKQILKFLKFSSSPRRDDEEETESGSDAIPELGEAFNICKDPEHLPPNGWLQRFGDFLRSITNMLRSKHSMFGFRVAVAIMSVAIMAFLRKTQHFYIEQRVFWAAIYLSLSMVRTAGQSTFIYFLRIW